MMLDKLPGVRKALVSMALDNGAINRNRHEEELVAAFSKYLAQTMPIHAGLRSVEIAHLIAIDRWLDNLSEEDLDTVCRGEENEVKEFLKDAPEDTQVLLTEIFDHLL